MISRQLGRARRLCSGTLAGLCALATLCPALWAQREVTVWDGPLVTKLDWNTHALVTGDFNGDGRTDLALLNNKNAQVELLLQRGDGDEAEPVGQAPALAAWEPVLEDAPFLRRSVVHAQTAFALATGDFNGDGRLDFALTGNRDSLAFWLQQEDGSFEKSQTFPDWEPRRQSDSLLTGDFDGDGRTDLAALGSDALGLFWQDAETGRMLTGDVFPLAQPELARLLAPDLDQDGLPDLTYLQMERVDRHLIWRRNLGERCYAAALPVKLPAHSDSLNFFARSGQMHAAFVEDFDHRFYFARFGSKPAPEHFGERQPRAHAFPFPLADAALAAVADLDADGLVDVVAGDAEGARAAWFRGDAEGFRSPETFPSLSGLTALTAWQQPDAPGLDPGRPALVFASAAEGLAGLAQWQPGDDSWPFPQLIPLEGEPLAVAAGTPAPEAPSLMVFIEKDGQKYHLTTVRADDADGWEIERQTLEGIRRRPQGLLWLDQGDGHSLLMVLPAREPARLYRWNGDEPLWAPLAEDSAVRRAMLDNPERERLGWHIPADGPAQLLLAGEGFVRVLEFEGDALVVRAQENLPQSNQEAEFPLRWGAGEDLLVYLPDNGHWRLLGDGTDDQTHRRLELGRGTRLMAEVLDTEAQGGVLLFGERAFQYLPDAAPVWGWETVGEAYHSPLKDLHFDVLLAGDFWGDEQPEWVAIDPGEHHLELLTYGDSWRQLLHFVLFEKEFFANQADSYEPRESLVADVTGDGFDDLVLLVHDRVLIYPGRAKSAAREAGMGTPDATAD